MKKAKITGTQQIELFDAPEPVPAAGEVKIKVERCGICGSDTEEYRRFGQFTDILGHEFAGTVVGLGKDVENFSIGDRVAAHTYDCTGFAEYAVCDAKRTIALPDELSMTEGALLEPLAVVLVGLRYCDFKIGDTTFVSGCGAIGLLAIEVLRAFGSRVIIASNRGEFRRAAAKDFGADYLIDPSVEPPGDAVQRILGDHVDFAVECAGVDASILACSNAIKPHGTVCQLGLNASTMNLTTVQLFANREWSCGGKLFGITPFDTNMFRVGARMIADGKITPKKIITHNFPLSEISDAFDTAIDRDKNTLKIMVDCES